METSEILQNMDLELKRILHLGFPIEKIIVNKEFYNAVSDEKLNGADWVSYRGFIVEETQGDQLFSVLPKLTTEVNKYHVKDEFDVYIGRGLVWGNPFTHRQLDETKAQFQIESGEESIEKYKEWILSQPHLMKQISQLQEKTLACFCKPKSCHGDVLAELANERSDGTKEP